MRDYICVRDSNPRNLLMIDIRPVITATLENKAGAMQENGDVSVAAPFKPHQSSKTVQNLNGTQQTHAWHCLYAYSCMPVVKEQNECKCVYVLIVLLKDNP